MASRLSLTYDDAVRILGREESALVNALDQALGLGLSIAAVFNPSNALPYFDAKNELIKHLHQLVTGLRDRVHRANRPEYESLLAAAHAVIVMTSFTEELADRLHKLDEDGKWKVELRRWAAPRPGRPAPTGTSRRQLVDWANRSAVPSPGPTRSLGQVIADLQPLYSTLAEQAHQYLMGLSRWDELSQTQQTRIEQSLSSEKLVANAVDRYTEHYIKLAAQVPEFLVWTILNEGAATRSLFTNMLEKSVRDGLARLQERLACDTAALGDLPALLVELSNRLGDSADDLRERVLQCHLLHQRVLDKPLLTPRLDEALEKVRFPANRTGYINPGYRLHETERSDEGSRLAQESMWADRRPRTALGSMLAAYLRSTKATRRPLLVLGDPGSGKSLLTKVLAAKLPPTEFAVVRVELRHVRSTLEISDQIDEELQRQTNKRYQLQDLTDQRGHITRVVIMDGLDELLQLSPHEGLGQYLERLVDFQEVEASFGRPVVAIATARTIVMDRVYVPSDTTVVKLEGFTDDQIRSWIHIWNGENDAYFREGELEPLDPKILAKHAELARQPLLLALLALYDAEGNSLRHAGSLSQAELYERLFRRYLERELDKNGLPTRRDEQLLLVEQRFRELSTIATGMINRGRRFITRHELEQDYESVGIRRGSTGQSSQTVSADDAVGQFFFLYRTEAKHRGVTLNEGYEFLHATFGEFLSARMIAHQLAQAAEVVQRAPTWNRLEAERHARSLLIPYLAQRPLGGEEQMLRFLEDIMGGLMPQRKEAALAIAGHLPDLMRSGIPDSFGYDMNNQSQLERLSILSLNLVLAALRTAGGPVELGAFCSAEQDTLKQWRRLVVLWKEFLPADDWVQALNSLYLRNERGYRLTSRDHTVPSRSQAQLALEPTGNGSRLSQLITEARLVDDEELVAAATLWHRAEESLAHHARPGAFGDGWRLAAAALRLGSLGTRKLDTAGQTLHDVLDEVAKYGPTDESILRLIDGGPPIWTDRLISAVATYVGKEPEKNAATGTLLRLIMEADLRGLSTDARRLLLRIPQTRGSEVSAAEIAVIVTLARRHHLKGLISGCVDANAIDATVMKLLGVEDLIWIFESENFTFAQLRAITHRVRDMSNYQRLMNGSQALSDYLDQHD